MDVPRFKASMTDHPLIDPVEFAAALIKKPSITPIDAGALDLLQTTLESLGFTCRRYVFGEGAQAVDNLYARLGTVQPNFCFAGHVDVVPPGEVDKWEDDPFEANIRDGQLWGRGAADMKGAIAAFVAGLDRFLKDASSHYDPNKGSISFLITGDEEGIAINGTKKLLAAIAEEGEIIDDCLVGEPTNPQTMGEMLKNGRRGSLNAEITVTGQQGHVAYPHRAINPAPVLISILSQLTVRHLDDGNEFFQPSNLEVTTIDIGNPTENMIPEKAAARFNIRFNTHHTGAALSDWIEGLIAAAQTEFKGQIDLVIRVSGEAFMTAPCKLTDVMQDAAEEVLGVRPILSTSGGTSDARFITHYANVAEFGLVGATMHQVNERVDVADINALSDIYKAVLTRYFA